MDKTLEFGYTNYKGEYSQRRVVPDRIHFGLSQYHEGKQWFLRAFDVDKQATRDFAMKDMRIGTCPCAEASGKAAKVPKP